MLDPISTLLQLTGPRPRVAVAYSGGIDSTVLAHALAKGRRRLGGLRLVHVDHGLQRASADWARRCAAQARSWRVPLTALAADARHARGDSPEAAARAARYARLAAALHPGEVLVTAQHRDDQAETLLLQLFRGAGVAGLSAMPAIAKFGAGWIARPLLATPRAQIDAYARRHRLDWIDDPSNADARFARNFLRHRVMPALRDYWPGVDRALARAAAHLAEAGDLLESAARRDLAAAADGQHLSVTALRALPDARRRNALRAFIADAGLQAPPASKLREMAGPLLAARSDAQPEVRVPGGVLRRRAARLELHVHSEVHPESVESSLPKSWRWRTERECLLNRGVLALLDDPAGPIDLARLPATLTLRAREGGESLRTGPRARTQTLKKLLQAAKLTVEQRATLPLVYSGKHLLAAGDRWIDARIAANDKSRRRARLVWRRAC